MSFLLAKTSKICSLSFTIVHFNRNKGSHIIMLMYFSVKKEFHEIGKMFEERCDVSQVLLNKIIKDKQ